MPRAPGRQPLGDYSPLGLRCFVSVTLYSSPNKTKVISFSLNAASIPAQADTNDIYLIDLTKVENFNGSQLAGKTIRAYSIQRENVGGVPTRIHLITTKTDGAQNPVVAIFDNDLNNATSVTVGDKSQPSISVRTTDPSLSADDIVYIEINDLQHTLIYHLADGTTLPMVGTVWDVDRALGMYPQFQLKTKSLAVNMDYVKEEDKKSILLTTGERFSYPLLQRLFPNK